MEEEHQKKKGSEKSKQLGIEANKEINFSDWYTQVVIKSEMMDYFDISGCYIFRPWSFNIWENIQNYFNNEIKKLGVQNCYFPLFISEKALFKEANHIEGFAPEVAWITKAGKNSLAEPIAIRPTSETVMYPAYAKWIRSHRDLPLKLNQWNNVVRWEFKDPTPFLRSREFLWQEGHTAFATEQEAAEEVLQILELYRKVYEELLAVPVIKGKKTEKEKFPGGYYTTTVEAFVPEVGRGIQAATSHCLGQNFAKMFDIQFENEKTEKSYVWQNSWGISTRSIGIMIMIHSDNKGLILPPRVAPYQIVLVPIFLKNTNLELLKNKSKDIIEELNQKGFRAHLDDRENYNPGWKYNHWELKGVPIRLEFGPRDLQNNTIVVVRRDDGSKETISLQDNFIQKIQEILDKIHNNLFEKAKKLRDQRTATVTKWDDFLSNLDSKKIILSPWCDEIECEEQIKIRTTSEKKESLQGEKKEEFEPISGSAKSLCKPFNQPQLEEGMKCFQCGKPAKTWCL